MVWEKSLILLAHDGSGASRLWNKKMCPILSWKRTLKGLPHNSFYNAIVSLKKDEKKQYGSDYKYFYESALLVNTYFLLNLFQIINTFHNLFYPP